MALLHLSVMLYVESVAKSLAKRLGDNKRLKKKRIISAHSVPGQHLTCAASSVYIFSLSMFSTRMNAGCNRICTALHHTFNRLFGDHVPAGTQPFIGHVTCQVDNYGSENKNHILIGYLGSLVGRGIIGSVSIQFMPVGVFQVRYVYPGACGERRFSSFVLSLIPSILYTVSSLNVHHLRYDQSIYHLASVLLKHIYA